MSNELRKTHVIGLIGRNIGSSRSPDMHEREAEALGVPLAYRLIDFTAMGLDDSELTSVLDNVAGMGFSGCNVTFPFKQKIIPLLDEISPDAQALGAVNTVKFSEGKKIGYNVDWTGFAESFVHGLGDVALNRVAQVGAGGAGAATAYALLSMGCKTLRLFDLDQNKAMELKARLSSVYSAELQVVASIEEACEGVDGIVQTSPIGMAAYPGTPVPKSLLKPSMWVSDIVYFPEDTEFLRDAGDVGCKTLLGSGMAICQAAAAFKVFTGIAPDLERMRATFQQ